MPTYSSVSVTSGVGNPIAVDVIAGVDYQLIKLMTGGQGVATELVPGNPLPLTPGFKTTEQCTRAVISFAASGDNTAIAAVASQYVRVYGILFTVDSVVSVKIGDSTPAYFTGAMKFNAGSGLFLAQQGEPHFITAIGKGLVLNLSSAVQCSGVVWYQQGT